MANYIEEALQILELPTNSTWSEIQTRSRKLLRDVDYHDSEVGRNVSNAYLFLDQWVNPASGQEDPRLRESGSAYRRRLEASEPLPGDDQHRPDLRQATLPGPRYFADRRNLDTLGRLYHRSGQLRPQDHVNCDHPEDWYDTEVRRPASQTSMEPMHGRSYRGSRSSLGPISPSLASFVTNSSSRPSHWQTQISESGKSTDASSTRRQTPHAQSHSRGRSRMWIDKWRRSVK